LGYKYEHDYKKYLKEVTSVYLSCGKPMNAEDEKYLREKNYKTNLPRNLTNHTKVEPLIALRRKALL